MNEASLILALSALIWLIVGVGLASGYRESPPRRSIYRVFELFVIGISLAATALLAALAVAVSV